MTRTSQLDAHYAVLQLDALRKEVVMSFQPTLDMLIAEFEEKHEGVPGHGLVRLPAYRRRVELLRKYRGALLAFVAAILALRNDCGTEPKDLPHGDDDVPPEYSRIRAAHEAYLRRKIGVPVDDDVDGMIDRYTEALLDYASGEGPGPWLAAAREGGDE